MTARTPLSRIERDAYLTARTAADVRAARRGPKPLVKRLVARTVARALIRALRITR